MEELAISLRMAERLFVVISAGMSVYLGYRLFFHLPMNKDHSGQIELPGVKVVLSRVGPGIFFAAFGCIVLGYSMTNPIAYNQHFSPSVSNALISDSSNSSPPVRSSFIGVTRDKGSPSVSQQEKTITLTVSPQQRAKAITDIELLNCVERLLMTTAAKENVKSQINFALSSAKLSLLKSVWDSDSWGELDEQVSPSDLPFQARSIFLSSYGGCFNE